MTILCSEQVATAAPEIVNCGSILTSDTADFQWIDPGQTASTVYGFWLGSTTGSNDIYNHAGGGVLAGNAITAFNLPTDGRTIYKTLIVYRNGVAGGITETVECTCTADTQVVTAPQINECDAILASSTATFSWNDPDQTAATTYDWWLGSTPLSNDIYDHNGGGVFNGSSVTVSGLPTDGRTIYKTLYVLRDGSAGGITDTIQCSCTATTILNADCMTFEQIRDAGSGFSCYPTGIDYVPAHVTEFLKLNPNVSHWEVNDLEVCALPDPEPSDGVFNLGLPSGGDDTATIQAAINNNAQVQGVAGAIYKINSTIAVFNATEIYDLATEVTGGQATQFSVTTANVKFYRSPINGNNASNFKVGWLVGPVATDFTLSRSGVRNILTPTGNAAGVWIRGGNNYHITCNDFRDLMLNAPATSTGNSSVLAVLNSGSGSLPGGYIANNYAENIHARLRNAGTTTDPEFYKQQGYSGTQSRPNIIANTVINGGKRLAKFQISDGFVAGNFYHWKDRQGPLGTRVMTTVIAVQAGSDRVNVINNHIVIEAEARYDGLFTMQPVSSGNVTNSDVHFDCNDIELIDTPPANFYAQGIYAKEVNGNTNNVLVNSSAKDNIIRGPGGTNHIFRIDSPYGGPLAPAGFDISGNMVTTPVLISDYRGSGATYVP